MRWEIKRWLRLLVSPAGEFRREKKLERGWQVGRGGGGEGVDVSITQLVGVWALLLRTYVFAACDGGAAFSLHWAWRLL